ncbi:mu-crystallin [Moesziomyces antarcticus T-34]|uniref:Mu-crystallin n=1 Tax=Pseudozyma antarctica (strain T-34) TaxID=1151754 RepID=M9LX11_PSEA3|nr:mu-crystallin [Moesziomyces antarcticus T-34]
MSSSASGVAIISSGEVDAALGRLSLCSLLRSQARAFGSLSTAQCPPRISLSTPAHTQLFMPTHTSGLSVVKIVSVPRSSRGIPGVNLVLGADGAVSHVVNSTSLTAVRTAAGSVLSTIMALGRGEVEMVVFGDGLQAVLHIALHARFYTLTKTSVVVGQHRRLSPEEVGEKRSEMVRQLGQLDCDAQIEVVVESQDVRKAVERAHVVCTCTPSRKALFDEQWVRGRTHVCAVGSYTHHMRELPAGLVEQAATQGALVVDSLDACRTEAGCLGTLTDEQWGSVRQMADLLPDAELAPDEWMQQVQGRWDVDGVSVFKSVGVATQDAEITRLIVDTAQCTRMPF